MITVDGNVVGSDIGGSGYGIEIEGDTVAPTILQGCYVSDNTITAPVHGIIFKLIDYTYCARNTIYNSDGASGSGIYYKGSKFGLCENNTVDGYAYSVTLGPDTPGSGRDSGVVIVKNNIFTDFTSAINLIDTDQLVINDYNCYDGNAETNGLTVDPEYNDSANGDFAPTNATVLNAGSNIRYLGAVEPLISDYLSKITINA
jgi:hypothetical protein